MKKVGVWLLKAQGDERHGRVGPHRLVRTSATGAGEDSTMIFD